MNHIDVHNMLKCTHVNAVARHIIQTIEPNVLCAGMLANAFATPPRTIMYYNYVYFVFYVLPGLATYLTEKSRERKSSVELCQHQRKQKCCVEQLRLILVYAYVIYSGSVGRSTHLIFSQKKSMKYTAEKVSHLKLTSIHTARNVDVSS